MKNKKVSISDALFSKVRKRVLGLLYCHPDSDFHTNEIIRITASGTGAVQRELKNLTSSGLITVKKLGNQQRYQANNNVPFFAELQGLIIKTFGLADIVKAALIPVAEQINVAFIYGSVAKQEEIASSDIDLMIIGEKLTYADLFHSLENTEKKLNRKINPTFYTTTEWLKKCKANNHFIIKILSQSKIFLIGTEHELKELR